VIVGLNTDDKLALFLQACAGTPFSWARWNCYHFAAAWVLVATGRNIDAGLPYVGTNADAALPWRTALADVGGIRRHASAQLGAPWRPACLAGDGDVVTLPGRLVPDALGICVGGRIACVGAPAGVAWQPLLKATGCWQLADIAGAA